MLVYSTSVHIQSKRNSHFTNAKTLTLKIQYTITLSDYKS